MLHGSCTALITPFCKGRLDEKAFEKVVEFQINAGTHGLVPSGTTGESPTLSHEEHDLVTEICVDVAKGRTPVIAGTGSNSTLEAIALTQHAQKAGADYALVVVPYYNKPNQEGLFQHFKAIHDATDIPIILYNVPGRTITDLNEETVLRLAELPRIVGIKDATGELDRPKSLTAKLPDFIQLSGEDDTVLEFLELGGVGCISVTANIAPKLCADMHNLWREGKQDEARAIQQRLMPLHNLMFIESSPAPVKYAGSLLGLCDNDIRLPLIPIKAENEGKIRTAMEELELI